MAKQLKPFLLFKKDLNRCLDLFCHFSISFTLSSPIFQILYYFFFCVFLSNEQQLEGDLEMLALVTYSSLIISMLALLLTVLVLSCLRGLKSNTRSIHSNTAAAMLLSELVFLLGVNQTEQQVHNVFFF